MLRRLGIVRVTLIILLIGVVALGLYIYTSKTPVKETPIVEPQETEEPVEEDVIEDTEESEAQQQYETLTDQERNLVDRFTREEVQFHADKFLTISNPSEHDDVLELLPFSDNLKQKIGSSEENSFSDEVISRDIETLFVGFDYQIDNPIEYKAHAYGVVITSYRDGSKDVKKESITITYNNRQIVGWEY